MDAILLFLLFCCHDYYIFILLLLTLLSAHAREDYNSHPVCLSVCHALILEITDN